MKSTAKACAIGITIVALCLLGTALYGDDWPTFGHDPQRTGWAFEESTLTPQNVSPTGAEVEGASQE